VPEITNPKSRQPLPPPTRVAPSALGYAELDVTSNFSFLRGASHPDELVYAAAELGYRAVAITDRNTLAGAVRAHAAARSCGMKLLIGARITLSDMPDILVWAPDRQSYARLCRLLTRGKKRVEKGEFQLSVQEFLQDSDGLLAGVDLAAGQERFRFNQGEITAPLKRVMELRDALGDRLSLIVSRVFGSDDAIQVRNLIRFSQFADIPLLATNSVHYHDPGRRPLQDVLASIRLGCNIRQAGFSLFANGERYLKSPEQMHRLFADLPEAVSRGIHVAERCSFQLDSLRYEYPDEIVPQGYTPLKFLTELAWKGAEDRYPGGIPQKVRDALNHELQLIEQLKFEAYFLTVYDLVKFARSRGILCQGRGSAANSAVCYCIGVTGVDPSKIDLLFERFISAARNEPPDIDVDFEHERREEVIQYVYQKYGRDRAGMTATLITYRGRSAVRDVGKAMGLSLDQVDSLAKRLDWWHTGVLTERQLRESGVDPDDPNVRRVVELTSELLGFPRHLGQHTGGMIMSRGLLCEMVPIENASMENRTVIEWDKDDVDELGLLKVDVLALGMLTMISKSFAFLEEQRNQSWPQEIDVLSPSVPMCQSPFAPLRYELHTIPPDDPLVYDMICDADTIGVFQIESRAQMSMLPRLRPRSFYDLVIEVAIVRPGPIQGNMVHPYLRRRCGQEPVSYPSEALRQVLHKTLGVPLFQEQAMKVAMVAAGFSADEADQLRRAMAAWRKSGAIRRFHQKIIDGMIKNGYQREFAENTFHQIQGFGEYGFPESHSASFALLVYVSSWLKRHHPAVFCAALLNSQPMGFYQPAQIVRDAREHGVEVLSIDVNHSQWDCTLQSAHPRDEPVASSAEKRTWALNGPAVRLGFRQIKGFRQLHADAIVAARKRVGSFISVEQFHRATGIPARALRSLAEADAFGALGLSRRKALWESLELKDHPAPLFTTSSGSAESPASSSLPEMPIGQEVMTDYATAGLSLKEHPLKLVRQTLNAQNILTAEQIAQAPHGRWVKTAGLVLIRQRPGTASGIVFVTLEDETGIVNLIVRPDIYERFRPAARHAGLLQCDGYLERQGQVVHIMAKRLIDRSDLIRGLEISSRDFH
jgi:error-prone DNA polymerase